jgi:hypothetical protein
MRSPERFKRQVVLDEGPEAAQRFEDTLGHVIHISKEELAKREAAYQKLRSTRPHRGPTKKSHKSDR